MRSICLDHLTLSDLMATEFVDVASQLGCAAVSLFVRPLPLGPYRDLVHDHTARADVVTALRENGLKVGVVEPFLIDGQVDWLLIERTVELVAVLNGRVNALGFDAERTRLRDDMGRLGDIARRFQVEMTIEAFPLSAVRTQSDALELAIACGPHVGVCVDTLHVIRSGGAWRDVMALPSERIFHVQLNDGPREPPADRYREATVARLPPGEGEFDLASFIPLIPESATLAVEAPFIAPGMTPIERGRMVVDATRRLLLMQR